MRRIHEVTKDMLGVSRRTYIHESAYEWAMQQRFPEILAFFSEVPDETRHDHLVMRVDRRMNAEQKRHVTNRCRALFDRACERSLCRMYRNGGRKPRRDH